MGWEAVHRSNLLLPLWGQPNVPSSCPAVLCFRVSGRSKRATLHPGRAVHQSDLLRISSTSHPLERKWCHLRGNSRNLSCCGSLRCVRPMQGLCLCGSSATCVLRQLVFLFRCVTLRPAQCVFHRYCLLFTGSMVRCPGGRGNLDSDRSNFPTVFRDSQFQ